MRHLPCYWSEPSADFIHLKKGPTHTFGVFAVITVTVTVTVHPMSNDVTMWHPVSFTTLDGSCDQIEFDSHNVSHD